MVSDHSPDFASVATTISSCLPIIDYGYLIMVRRVVFLGRTGAGKSASGNNILQQDAFYSSTSGLSVTKQCQRGTGIRNGVSVEIIDSPGLFDTGLSNEEITKEIVKCIAMTAPGPHAFVLVLRIDRFTQEEQDTVEHYRKVFGDDFLRYLVVLFTRKDDLNAENKSIEDYIQHSPERLRRLLESCNDRYVAFNNRGSEVEKNRDVQDFLNLIERTVQENGNTLYTNDMYEEAERAMKIREQQLMKEHDEDVDKERRQIERECKEKMQKMEKNQDEIIKSLQDEVARIETTKSKEANTTPVVKELQDELRRVKELLEDARREAAAQRAQAAKEADERKKFSESTVPNYREQAQQEVNRGQEMVMSVLTFLGDTVLKTVMIAVGSALAGGLENMIGAKFQKISDKIRPPTGDNKGKHAGGDTKKKH
ncbi:GTPase IMAP family member 4-like isoform X1 [Haliotis rufescens]|uniref:GTPase IMAP family member 4-like isoform X1 n=1 Tax=Haliotis rufescens TaxID=6454 RepID=UPI001EAFB9CF|nr:GTPase IMAP family member 4-like isoform X1 [Haliotis rufescens]